MLIDSEFHDFYDSASIHGIDKTCVYNRKVEFIEGKFQFLDSFFGKWIDNVSLHKIKKGVKFEYSIKRYVLGFCGNIYPFIYVQKINKTEDKIVSNYGFYSLDKIKDFFKKEDLSFKENSYFWFKFYSSDYSLEAFNTFFELNHYKDMLSYFVKYHVPVFVYGYFKDKSLKPQLVLNPKLQDFKFAQVKDPQSAFQDIFMFLSGVLGAPLKETVKVSDKTKAAKSGHDGKYSFKKRPKNGKK